jgi:hypothetical protein
MTPDQWQTVFAELGGGEGYFGAKRSPAFVLARTVYFGIVVERDGRGGWYLPLLRRVK